MPSALRPAAVSGLIAGLAALLTAGPARAADPSGLWLTETGSSRVRVARCGAGYCGTLASAPGKGLDVKNPDPALRTRSVVGVQILDAPRAEGGGYAGTLYNPNDGKTYSGSVKLTGPDTLEVSGCVLGVLCKRQTWTRVR
ncbi:DUF2147 domain-containing protein [Methylobacterium sp. NEAU 140]|uniref:DUF2147 domain-containing protein n=1 Tax=Methylobacterium sp. NEAU 140 TaxID=3064945 RepID=UPI002735B033|nr:DUF2147 domain-containing protein [Methylobacterium sp. NEAU 140]MDP4022559.1 DUF2147 domain-containing protein [Methylobacterium sp. NEAU 140]